MSKPPTKNAVVFQPTHEQVDSFKNNGFLIVSELFSSEEANAIQKTVKSDSTFDPHNSLDQFVNTENAQLVVWNKAQETLWGAIGCSERVVNVMEALLGFEVYHYHSKLSIKHPGSGGKWCWHQDYGYWYDYGCLFPDLGSVMIALDENTRENGCLKVISGSHKLGRLNHEPIDEFSSQVMPLDDPRQVKPAVKSAYKQTGAEPERVQSILNTLDVVYVELKPGDAVFFHCNLLHSSEENKTKDSPRWSLISCYNGAHNSPDRTIAKSLDHEIYTPLKKIPDTELKEMISKF